MKNVRYIGVLLMSCFLFSSCLKEELNPATGIPNPMVSIEVVRSAYKTSEVKLSPEVLSGASFTSGIVISSPQSKNLPAGAVVMQSNWRNRVRGIILNVDPAVAETFSVGDSIVINLNQATLSSKNGSLQISGLNASSIEKISDANPVIVRPVSVSELTAKFSEFESTMVSITGDIKPFPISGETFAGVKAIDDGSGNELGLYTEANAIFAANRIAPSASFVGILYKDATPQLRLQKFADMMYPSGPVYAGYPESFESPDAATKASYASKTIDLSTGSWTLNNCLLGVTGGRDRMVTGTQAIRFQQNLTTHAYLQMNYDLPNGASKVTVWYGSYYTDASSTWELEYSTDAGLTWVVTSEKISDAAPTSQGLTPKMATILLDIKVPVRFRVKKLGLGATAVPKVYNGRLGMDDFTVYQNY